MRFYLFVFISMLWIGYSFYFMNPTCGQWIEQENDGKWYVMDNFDEKQKVVDGPFNSELQAEKSISICVSDFNKRRSKYGTIYNLLPSENPQNIAERLIKMILSIVFFFGPPYLLFKYFYFQNKSKNIDSGLDSLEDIVLNEEEVEETIKSLDKVLDHLDKLETSAQNKLPDFSVSEEDFKVEPIKTLFKLSKELPEKEYHKKAVDIWKEYIKEEIKIEIGEDFYGTLNLKKDLFHITLEYIDHNHKSIYDYVSIIPYQSLKDSDFFKDNYEYISDFISDSYTFSIPQSGEFPNYRCQLSYADTTKLIKPIEERLIFLANSDIDGDYSARSDSLMEEFEEIGRDYDAKQFNSYEDCKKAFFSFDQLCEYLAKCKIYDYKEALEAGALGEDIDFRHFDISKMEK